MNLFLKYLSSIMRKQAELPSIKVRKYFNFHLMTGLFFVCFTSCTSRVSSPLRIGTNLWTGYETLYLARDLSYYDQKSIKLVDFSSGTEEVRAYRNHEIEGAGLSIDQALVLAATQENIKIITIMDISHGADVILAKPEFTDMKLLKGKRVGVEATSLGAYFLARALEKNGMTRKDVQIVSLEPSEHESAFKTGQVDAVVTFGPARAKLLASGAKLIFDSSQIPGEIIDVIVVNTAAIASSPEEIQVLVNGRFRALDYFEKNNQDAGSRMAKRTQVSPEQILSAFTGLKQPSLQENQKLLNKNNSTLVDSMKKLLKIMLENKLISKEIDPASILDDHFVKNAKF